jgi:glycosyltransferase involved in cell wall biosynthesis
MQPQKIIFLSLVQINSLDERGIYHDLLRQFIQNGHEVTVLCPVERRSGLPTRVLKSSGITILQVRTPNIQKSPIWEKALATILLNTLLCRAIKKYLKSISFDLILYATPPITFAGLIGWLKQRNCSKSYLLLKDIFPQNAVDMGLLRNGSFLHKWFLRQEKKLYQLSDRIGCMSPANLSYICSKYPNLRVKIEINPNSIDLTKLNVGCDNRSKVLRNYEIPVDSVIFMYGGNLGKPQGTTFILDLLNSQKLDPRAFLLIVGDGTDYPILKKWFDCNKPNNAKLIQRLSKPIFDELAACCDVGLIILRREFTIPNFPSRLLTYLENRMAILAFTDEVSDVGPIAKAAGFGDFCFFDDKESALQLINFFVENSDTRVSMGKVGFEFMQKHFDVKHSYNKIVKILQ